MGRNRKEKKGRRNGDRKDRRRSRGRERRDSHGRRRKRSSRNRSTSQQPHKHSGKRHASPRREAIADPTAVVNRLCKTEATLQVQRKKNQQLESMLLKRHDDNELMRTKHVQLRRERDAAMQELEKLRAEKHNEKARVWDLDPVKEEDSYTDDSSSEEELGGISVESAGNFGDGINHHRPIINHHRPMASVEQSVTTQPAGPKVTSVPPPAKACPEAATATVPGKTQRLPLPTGLPVALAPPSSTAPSATAARAVPGRATAVKSPPTPHTTSVKDRS